MSQIDGVSIVREANVYFEGGVVSRTILHPDGSRQTLGMMQPGQYAFDTGAAELMEILSGELEVLLPGANGWRAVRGGEAFEVAANSRFEVRASTLVDYCCTFLA
jgi:uncharacterized protein YaiE (UPF0345 family)